MSEFLILRKRGKFLTATFGTYIGDSQGEELQLYTQGDRAVHILDLSTTCYAI